MSCLNWNILTNFVGHINTLLIRNLSGGVDALFTGYDDTLGHYNNSGDLNWNILAGLLVYSFAPWLSVFNLVTLL